MERELFSDSADFQEKIEVLARKREYYFVRTSFNRMALLLKIRLVCLRILFMFVLTTFYIVCYLCGFLNEPGRTEINLILRRAISEKATAYTTNESDYALLRLCLR